MRDIIVITMPEIFRGETDIVNALFDNGMRRLHLRKPGVSAEHLAEWTERIDPQYRQRIVVHDHHTILRTMGLGGIHLNARNPDVPAWLAEERERQGCVTLSRSCHTLEEVARWSPVCDYVFLSPIFDSISKCGYTAGFTIETLCRAHSEGLFSHPTYALGGVTAENIQLVSDLGFAGAAVLGSLWHTVPFTTDNIVSRLRELQGI